MLVDLSLCLCLALVASLNVFFGERYWRFLQKRTHEQSPLAFLFPLLLMVSLYLCAVWEGTGLLKALVLLSSASGLLWIGIRNLAWFSRR